MTVALRILITLVHYLIVVPLTLVYLVYLVGQWAYNEISFRMRYAAMCVTTSACSASPARASPVGGASRLLA